jgi:hypothetical protein
LYLHYYVLDTLLSTLENYLLCLMLKKRLFIRLVSVVEIPQRYILHTCCDAFTVCVTIIRIICRILVVSLSFLVMILASRRLHKIS